MNRAQCIDWETRRYVSPEVGFSAMAAYLEGYGYKPVSPFCVELLNAIKEFGSTTQQLADKFNDSRVGIANWLKVLKSGGYVRMIYVGRDAYWYRTKAGNAHLGCNFSVVKHEIASDLDEVDG